MAAEVRAEQARQRLTGRELANRVDLPSSTVARWLRNDTDMTLDAAAVLAGALGLSLVELIERAEDTTIVRDLPSATRPPRPKRVARPVVRQPAVLPDATSEFGCTRGLAAQIRVRSVHTRVGIKPPHRRPLGRPNLIVPAIRDHERASTYGVRRTHRSADAA